MATPDREPEAPGAFDHTPRTAAYSVQAQLAFVSASQLRHPLLERRRAGGYRRSDVDRLLERAARTLEDLAGKVKEAQAEAADLRLDLAATRVRLAHIEASRTEPSADEPSSSPEEMVGEAPVTPHRTAAALTDAARIDAERLISEAQERARRILAEADRGREAADRLQAERQAAAERALEQAVAQRDEALAERGRLINDAVAEAAQVRVELEAEADRLVAAIADLRSGWAEFLGGALSRLERIDFETRSVVADDLRGGVRGRRARAGDPATDLQQRMSGRTDGSKLV